MPESPGSEGPTPQPPHPGQPTEGPTAFTVAEATRLLPYLRSTLAAVQSHLADMRKLAGEMRRMEAVGRTPEGSLILAADREATARRLARHQAECERSLRQIQERGCQVKDPSIGLCDFPAVIDGQPVLLCWRIDEPAIAFYHGERDGYTGRRPIPPETP